MAHILEVDSVIKKYNSKSILLDVYLKCETGDILAIFGKNGAGKSTLLKIIYGTEDAENKMIKIDNKILMKPYKKVNIISYLPQDSFIPKELFVSDAIKFFLGSPNIDKISSNDEIIDSIKNTRIRNLSGGELRYLEIKLILYLDTIISLLDEPFLGLSPLLIEKIKKIIKECSKNKVIIITDHDYQNVLDIATKIYLVKDTRAIHLKEKTELVEHGYLTLLQ
ncbi:ATP-binding cassette domain-containing protein [Flavobacterium piscis]|uniref:ABC-type lipopolysaccharide export system ATPase subunit n=1 Tax=Flavobacterium piscis TaxID=1114874 RepID=A0ABU1Y450_9FLAO|nr:ATP-binding cassette domain-containing protein [Flavobacterium piscis]MDR7209014.1 ABC-type lipopolysaccharide export system ATPase subunit [Flavobacterium piscis]